MKLSCDDETIENRLLLYFGLNCTRWEMQNMKYRETIREEAYFERFPMLSKWRVTKRK